MCPSCAEVYRRDAYQLIRAGLAGGKGLPATVNSHPAVFVTLTRAVVRARAHQSLQDRPTDPVPAPPSRTQCPHGVDLRCSRLHTDREHVLGTPLCPRHRRQRVPTVVRQGRRDATTRRRAFPRHPPRRHQPPTAPALPSPHPPDSAYPTLSPRLPMPPPRPASPPTHTRPARPAGPSAKAMKAKATTRTSGP